MKIKLSTRFAVIAALLLALAAPMTRAQDDADDGFGKFYVEAALWVSQAVGVEFRPATVVDEGDPFNSKVLSTEHNTESRARYRGGDKPKQFVNQCERLYRDEELWQKVREQALGRIGNDCSKDDFRKQLLSIFGG